MEKNINNVMTLYDYYDESYDSKVCYIEIGAEQNPDSEVYDFAKETTSPFITCISRISGSCYLIIKKTYFEKKQDECNEMIKRIFRRTQRDLISLFPNPYLTEEIISIINENKNIEKFGYEFGELKKEDLSIELLKIINEPSERINIQSFIDASYNYNTTIELNELYSDADLKKLKMLFEIFPQRTVIISGVALSKIDELLPIIFAERVIINDKNMYVSSNKYKHVDMDYNEYNKISHNLYLYEVEFNNAMEAILYKYKNIVEEYNNVYFMYDSSDYISSTCVRNKDKILDNIVEEIKALKLTPAEAYWFIFSITKLFKSYKKEGEDEDFKESRYTYFTLFNEYIVCSGYTDLIYELVKKYNDPNLKVVSYTCLDKTHSRLLVQINDKKYNIKGLYASEPTWGGFRYDNECFLLTKDEIDALDSRNGFDHVVDCSDILMIGSEGEKKIILLQYQKTKEDYQKTREAWDEADFAVWKLYSRPTDKFMGWGLSDSLLEHASKISEDTMRNMLSNFGYKLFDHSGKKNDNYMINIIRTLYFFFIEQKKILKNYISSHVEEIVEDIPKIIK